MFLDLVKSTDWLGGHDLQLCAVQDIFEEQRPPLVSPGLQLCVSHELLPEELCFSVYVLERNGMHPEL